MDPATWYLFLALASACSTGTTPGPAVPSSCSLVRGVRVVMPSLDACRAARDLNAGSSCLSEELDGTTPEQGRR